jgi:hypothetical protein
VSRLLPILSSLEVRYLQDLPGVNAELAAGERNGVSGTSIAVPVLTP